MAKQTLKSVLAESTIGVAKIDGLFTGTQLVIAALLQNTKENPYIGEFDVEADCIFDKATGRQIQVLVLDEADMLIDTLKSTGAVDVKGLRKNEFRAINV